MTDTTLPRRCREETKSIFEFDNFLGGVEVARRWSLDDESMFVVMEAWMRRTGIMGEMEYPTRHLVGAEGGVMKRILSRDTAVGEVLSS